MITGRFLQDYYITGTTGGSGKVVSKNRFDSRTQKSESVRWVLSKPKYSATLKRSNVKSNVTNGKSRVENIGLHTQLVGGHTTTRTKWAFFENAHIRHQHNCPPWRSYQQQLQTLNRYNNNNFLFLILFVGDLPERFFWLVVVEK